MLDVVMLAAPSVLETPEICAGSPPPALINKQQPSRAPEPPAVGSARSGGRCAGPLAGDGPRGWRRTGDIPPWCAGPPCLGPCRPWLRRRPGPVVRRARL